MTSVKLENTTQSICRPNAQENIDNFLNAICETTPEFYFEVILPLREAKVSIEQTTCDTIAERVLSQLSNQPDGEIAIANISNQNFMNLLVKMCENDPTVFGRIIKYNKSEICISPSISAPAVTIDGVGKIYIVSQSSTASWRGISPDLMLWFN